MLIEKVMEKVSLLSGMFQMTTLEGREKPAVLNRSKA